MICVANLPASGGFEKNSLVGLVLFSLSDLDMDLDLPLLLALPLLHKEKRNEKEIHVNKITDENEYIRPKLSFPAVAIKVFNI